MPSDTKRKEAVKRMKKWFDQGKVEAVLNLRGLNLSCLPESLPPFLQKIDASDNYLRSLPILPPSLKMLNVANNYSLFTYRFDLRTDNFPDLPPSLEELNASYTGLQSLTDNLPPGLKKLHLVGNELTSLPKKITTLLKSDCVIDLERNRFSRRSIDALQKTIDVNGYNGPKFLGLSYQRANTSREINNQSASSSSASPKDKSPSSSGNLNFEEQGTLRSSELAQYLWQKKSKKAWDAWAESKDASHQENRKEAVKRMKEWVEQRNPEEVLNLKALGLASLPEFLPLGLRKLDISSNLFHRLPENLPPSLKVLDVSENMFGSLPNNLRENLPSLKYLDLSSNRLKSLPEDIVGMLRKNYVVFLQGNPLPEKERERAFQWDAWAESKDASPRENRKEAVKRLKQWFEQGNVEEALNLKALGLISLPQLLPLGLRKLDISSNLLPRLSRNLPPSLEALNVSENMLRELPRHLCKNLPFLKYFDLSSNQLESLPKDIAVMLRENCVVVLQDNPLPERARELVSQLNLGVKNKKLFLNPQFVKFE